MSKKSKRFQSNMIFSTALLAFITLSLISINNFVSAKELMSINNTEFKKNYKKVLQQRWLREVTQAKSDLTNNNFKSAIDHYEKAEKISKTKTVEYFNPNGLIKIYRMKLDKFERRYASGVLRDLSMNLPNFNRKSFYY